MAVALPQDLANLLNLKDSCANCTVYSWKQPTNKDHLRRCSGCRAIWYCDEMCQKEHWHHTHKNQCKYLSNKKVLLKAKHDETTCLVCKREAGAGKEEMLKQSNPILPCTLSKDNRDIMNIDESFSEGWACFPLAEMTGQFHTKVEAIIATFMRILVKMKKTNHLLWQIPQSAALDHLYKMLWRGKNIYLGQALTTKKPGPLAGQLVENSNAVTKCILEKMFAIEDLWVVAETRHTGEEFSSLIKPWEILKVLAALLFEGNGVLPMSAADRVGVVGVSEEINRIRTTALQFNRMRDKVLSLMSTGLVPYTSLVVDGLCDGNLIKQCNVCREEVTVKNSIVTYFSVNQFSCSAKGSYTPSVVM